MFFRRRYFKLKKNVVVFTLHKAGSMVLHRCLKDICDHNNIRYHSEHQDKPDKLPVKKIFEGKNYIARHNGCFGPVRFFLPSRGLERANILLHLRDPRDVLTSMFFSYAFMHQGQVPANTGIRKQVAEAGIDQFVLDLSSDGCHRYEGDYGTGGNYKHHIGNILERYERYLRDVVGQPNATVVFYEEMVADFPTWLRKVVAPFELENAEETYRFVLDRHEAEVKPAGENPWLHKRKVTPGDYKEKLKPETIEELNRRFGKVLEALQALRAPR
ncbi:MAG: sulfotransferase domain-containing protein [Chthoniobacterales bacterium]